MPFPSSPKSQNLHFNNKYVPRAGIHTYPKDLAHGDLRFWIYPATRHGYAVLDSSSAPFGAWGFASALVLLIALFSILQKSRYVLFQRTFRAFLALLQRTFGAFHALLQRTFRAFHVLLQRTFKDMQRTNDNVQF